MIARWMTSLALPHRPVVDTGTPPPRFRSIETRNLTLPLMFPHRDHSNLPTILATKWNLSSNMKKNSQTRAPSSRRRSPNWRQSDLSQIRRPAFLTGILHTFYHTQDYSVSWAAWLRSRRPLWCTFLLFLHSSLPVITMPPSFLLPCPL